jgi:hypothetical protein
MQVYSEHAGQANICLTVGYRADYVSPTQEALAETLLPIPTLNLAAFIVRHPDKRKLAFDFLGGMRHLTFVIVDVPGRAAWATLQLEYGLQVKVAHVGHQVVQVVQVNIGRYERPTHIC